MKLGVDLTCKWLCKSPPSLFVHAYKIRHWIGTVALLSLAYAPPSAVCPRCPVLCEGVKVLARVPSVAFWKCYCILRWCEEAVFPRTKCLAYNHNVIVCFSLKECWWCANVFSVGLHKTVIRVLYLDYTWKWVEQGLTAHECMCHILEHCSCELLLPAL